MHVVHLYDGHEQVYDGRGSVPGVVWNVARETADAGHDVTVIERQWDGLQSTAVHDGVEFDRLDLRTGADEPWTRVPYEEVTSPVGFGRLVTDRTNFALASMRRLRRMEFGVLHVHLPFAANVLATFAPHLRDQMVYTAHLGELRLNVLEADSADGPDVPEILSRFSPDVYLAKRAAQTTVLNTSIEDVFVDQGVSRTRLDVVPNGVDVERFGDVSDDEIARVSETYGLGDGPIVLFVGTIMPRKGVTDLVEALARVVEAGRDDVQAVVAGEDELDGSYVAEVESLIAENDLEANISMPGFVPAADLPGLYAAADVFVMPSLEEGFGMTVIEAMAAGTPVVGTRVGAIPDLVEEGETGSLADPGDVSGVAASIRAVLDADEEGNPMDERVREVAAEYSWKRIAEEFQSVYGEVTT